MILFYMVDFLRINVFFEFAETRLFLRSHFEIIRKAL